MHWFNGASNLYIVNTNDPSKFKYQILNLLLLPSISFSNLAERFYYGMPQTLLWLTKVNLSQKLKESKNSKKENSNSNYSAS